jgi:hypothetical protein
MKIAIKFLTLSFQHRGSSDAKTEEGKNVKEQLMVEIERQNM